MTAMRRPFLLAVFMEGIDEFMRFDSRRFKRHQTAAGAGEQSLCRRAVGGLAVQQVVDRLEGHAEFAGEAAQRPRLDALRIGEDRSGAGAHAFPLGALHPQIEALPFPQTTPVERLQKLNLESDGSGCRRRRAWDFYRAARRVERCRPLGSYQPGPPRGSSRPDPLPQTQHCVRLGLPEAGEATR